MCILKRVAVMPEVGDGVRNVHTDHTPDATRTLEPHQDRMACNGVSGEGGKP